MSNVEGDVTVCRTSVKRMSNLVLKRCQTLDPTFLTYRLLPNTQELPESAPICTRTQYLVHYLHKHWVLASTSSLSEGDNAPKCSGAESSNANISFPEHFEGKRQSGEMYQKDCLPLLSTFCKFQRLKVKGSRVMLVCLHQHQINTVAHENGSTSQRVQAVHTQRFNSFVAATSCICVWLLKCTQGGHLPRVQSRSAL